MKELAIEVKNLSKKYERNTGEKSGTSILKSFKKPKVDYDYVLKNINLEIEKGDVIGIIGANGAGKSTFLKILSGITAPSEGEIIVNGKIASILELGIGFDSELSGYQNIFNGGQLLGFSKKEIQNNIESIIEFSGIKEHIYTPIKHYSSGMLIRLAYSLVTNVKADILLFDEILAVGDIEFSQKVLSEIFAKVKLKKTILFVSHDLNFIPVICNKIIVFKDSDLLYYGDTGTGISLYKKKYISKSINDFKQRQSDKKAEIDVQAKTAEIDNNHLFKITSVTLEKSKEIITMNDEIVLQIGLEKKQSENKLDIGYILYSLIDKGPVFTSAFSWSANQTICDNGKYILRNTIPAKFLNAGNYSINLSVIIDQENVFVYNNIIEFVVSPNENEELSMITTKAITSLIPALDWQIKKA